MGCMTGIVGMLIPRVLILFGWVNDPSGWGAAFSSQLWPILGFIFMPWTTFFFALFAAGGFDVIRLLVMLVAVVADLATWGIGGFAARKPVSNFRM